MNMLLRAADITISVSASRRHHLGINAVSLRSRLHMYVPSLFGETVASFCLTALHVCGRSVVSATVMRHRCDSAIGFRVCSASSL